MKTFFTFILCCLMIGSYSSMEVYAEIPWPSDTEIQAESGIVVDADSGAVLWGKDMDTPYPPASITKLLTALIVLEHSELDETVTFSERAVNNVEHDSGNKLNVAPGDQLSVEDCLYSLLVHSCNQAANALAEHVAGSQEQFVEMMNEKITALGCTDSHFDNPSGLNGDTQYVTARDMALISIAAFSNPLIVEISGALSHTFLPTINNPDGLTIYAEHRLLKAADPNDQYYYPPAKGGKTGYLHKAGNTLVTYAEQDGRRLVSVILRGKKAEYFLDGKELLEFGFDNFENFVVSDYASDYTKEGATVSAGGKTYMGGDLEIDQTGVVTLPKGASFSDTKQELVLDLQGEYPERSIAFIQYSYGNNKAGGAYLKQKEAPVPETEPESAGIEHDAVGKTEKAEKTGFHISPIIICLLALAIAGGGCASIICAKKREEKRLALRRAERRRRLKAEGVEEEEFDRLLSQRHDAGRKRKE